MSKRTKFLLGIGVIATLVIGWQIAAFAVHNTTAFEMDGNAVSGNGSPAADDWDRVCYEVQNRVPPPNPPLGCTGTTGTSTNGATATAFVAEPNPQTTFFTGGGSKDTENIPSWLWKNDTGGLPDKANLTNSYAASYTNGGQKLLFFGADRFDNSGDAAIAFWFFKNPVGLKPEPPASGTASGDFSAGNPPDPNAGTHAVGDLLVISNFSNGGSVPTINAYTWDPTCTKADNNNPQPTQCGAKNLRVVASSNQASCSNPGGPVPDNACAIVNSADGTPAPWNFTDKGGNHTFLKGEFFEGGVNLSQLGLGNACFSTALAETRTSTSPTSTLKDFTIGKFGECSTQVTTQQQGDASKPIGTGENDSGKVQVTDQATVTVGGATTWAGKVQFYLCGPVATGTTTCADNDPTRVAIGSPQSVSNNTPTVTSAAATVTSVGKYCWKAKFTSETSGVPDRADTGGEIECFNVTPATPTLTTSAGPDVALGQPVTDTATLSGTANQPGTPVINPTTQGGPAGGTITFELYGPGSGNGTCGPKVFTSDLVQVSGNGTYPDPAVSFTPEDPGTYHWKATYSGDSPNTNGASHNADCNEGGEEVVVGNSGVTTTPKKGDGSAIDGPLSIGPGSVQVKDSATVNVTGQTTWSGNMTFFLCKVDAPATCTSGGTQIGGNVPVSSTTPPGATVLSDAATVTSAGRYCWRGVFTADPSSGVPNATDSSAGECFTVNPVTPTLATTAGEDVDLGNPITDTATLTGTANKPGDPVINPTTPGGPATGTITFTLFGPTAPGDTGCGPQVDAATQTVDVTDGDGTYPDPPASFEPTEPGIYHWKASYTPADGDPNNLAATHNSDCSDENEDVVVTSVPSSMTTAQSFIPNDEATVSAEQGGPLNGTVTFTLFESADCTGDVKYTQDVDIVDGLASGTTVNTTNTEESTTSANVSWLVSYDSTNPAQEDIPPTCEEKTALDIQNGGTIPPPPSP